MRLSPSIALLRTQSDDRLVALAREGHEPAFAALVERYRRTVVRVCRRVLSESRAEDAAQQVFMSAWSALGRGDDVRDVRPWLLRIARNTALNALRNPGYDYDELAESLRSGAGADDELERREVMRQTLAGLAALPDNQRDALLRSAVHGAAHADIARDLGISEGATRQLVLRARASMRSAVSALTPLPLLNWAASGSGPGVAELAAGGGGGAGATALLAKTGAVVVLAGGAVATPAIVARGDRPRPPRVAESTAATKPTPAAARATRAADPKTISAPATASATPRAAAPPARASDRRPPAALGQRRRHRNAGGEPRSHSGADDSRESSAPSEHEASPGPRGENDVRGPSSSGRHRDDSAGSADDHGDESGDPHTSAPAPVSTAPTIERDSGRDRSRTKGGDASTDRADSTSGHDDD